MVMGSVGMTAQNSSQRRNLRDVAHPGLPTSGQQFVLVQRVQEQHADEEQDNASPGTGKINRFSGSPSRKYSWRRPIRGEDVGSEHDVRLTGSDRRSPGWSQGEHQVGGAQRDDDQDIGVMTRLPLSLPTAAARPTWS